MSKIARKVVRKLDSKNSVNNPLSKNDLQDYLGVQKFNYGEAENKDRVGVVTGLAWTEVGGEILKIESVIMPGKGKMQITGKLGEVMQESVKAAKSYIRSKSLDFGIVPHYLKKGFPHTRSRGRYSQRRAISWCRHDHINCFSDHRNTSR